MGTGNRWTFGPGALAAGILLACGGSSDESEECSVTAVSVAASATTIDSGQTSALTATVTDNGFCGGAVTWSASPEGASLTPSGLMASLTSTTPATYTVTATSNDDESVSGSIDVTVTSACGTPSGTVVAHAADIVADEVWEGDGIVHSVPGSLQIRSGTVTIEPCAIVSLGAGASITARGSEEAPARLVAAGTSPSRFVSFVRANEAEPWGTVRGYNVSSTIELHYTELHGGGEFGGTYRNPTITLAGGEYSDPPVGLIEVDHVTIDGSVGVGIYLDGSVAFTANSTDLTVQNTADYPLAMTMMALGSIPTGTYTGNAADAVLVHSQFNVFADLTVKKRLPVHIQTASMTVAAVGNVTSPVTLTLEPGVELRFEPLTVNPGARVTFGGNGQLVNRVGVLIAEGTEDDPIVFTSGADTPAAGDWEGLWLDTANGSRMDHVIIEYAGAENGITSVNCKPKNITDDAALIVGDFDDQYIPPADLITNSTIRFSAGSAINAMWVSDALGPDLTQNGNTLSDYAECAQTYNSVTGGCPSMGCYGSD